MYFSQYIFILIYVLRLQVKLRPFYMSVTGHLKYRTDNNPICRRTSAVEQTPAWRSPEATEYKQMEEVQLLWPFLGEGPCVLFYFQHVYYLNLYFLYIKKQTYKAS